jgi:hypothetical protein
LDSSDANQQNDETRREDEWKFSAAPIVSQRRKKLRLCVAGVMHLNTFRQQTLAPPLAPSRQSGAATLRLHSRTKTVLAFACAL